MPERTQMNDAKLWHSHKFGSKSDQVYFKEHTAKHIINAEKNFKKSQVS